MISSHRAFKFLIKYPSRERPDQFFNTLDTYIDLLSGQHEVHFLITLDDDDVKMNNDAVKSRLQSYDHLQFIFGPSKNKVDAINRDVDRYPSYDILILATDGMVPEIQGYDEIIASKFRFYFPNLDGVTWFNNGNQENEVNGHCIIGRRYYKRFDYIYHPDYSALFCENEFTEVANGLHKQVFIDQVILKQRHQPNVQDSLKQRNAKTAHLDEQVYISRKLQNFGLPRDGAIPAEARREDLSTLQTPVNFLWSILICTSEGKESGFNKILQQLTYQIQLLELQNEIEILVDRDSGETPMGFRRNKLIASATGKYINFIEDDTRLDGQFIKSIYKGLQEDPDVVTLQGTVTTPTYGFNLVIHSLSFNKLEMVDGIYRTPPNHLDPIRRAVAIRIPFRENSLNSDEEWALQISSQQVLQQEYAIDAPVYSGMLLVTPKTEHKDLSVKNIPTSSPSPASIQKKQTQGSDRNEDNRDANVDLNDLSVINKIIWG